MSRVLENGKTRIDSKDECKYMYNKICCLGDSMYCGEYPNKQYHKGCEDCDYFEKEDMVE